MAGKSLRRGVENEGMVAFFLGHPSYYMLADPIQQNKLNTSMDMPACILCIYYSMGVCVHINGIYVGDEYVNFCD